MLGIGMTSTQTSIDGACQGIEYKWSQSVSDLYNSAARFGFGVGLSLIAISLIWGEKKKGSGFMAWLLANPIMAPLGKLSFHAYLWHFIFVHWYYGQQLTPVYYTW